ncbi:MAG TPA: HipA family kinase [Candidatus Angelobacter sp.]|nr:HipA family kinase [Candidatus Angelobacter sp.]
MAEPEIVCSISPTQPQPVLLAVQHIRKLTGNTQAHLMRASDGNLYVTKFSNNPLGIRVLASEFLATKIGLFVGLPMPEVAVIEVPSFLIDNTPGLQMETEDREVIRCASGRHLAVRYVGDVWKDRVFDYMPKAMFGRVSNKADFLRILPFDKWLGNCDDRQAVYVSRAGKRQYQAIFIDQHDCFDGAKWQFLDDPMMGTHSAKHVYEGVTGWNSFEPMLTQVEGVAPGNLWQLASEIPVEWYGGDHDALCCLIETLFKRRSVIRDLITTFSKCARHPFPQWDESGLAIDKQLNREVKR